MDNSKQNITEELQKLDKMRQKIGGSMVHMREGAFKRFPFLFIFLSTFGLVATFLGIEKLIDTVPFFNNNPLLILLTGIVTLVVTGSLYKKLS